jgi:hypothetical protein
VFRNNTKFYQRVAGEFRKFDGELDKRIAEAKKFGFSDKRKSGGKSDADGNGKSDSGIQGDESGSKRDRYQGNHSRRNVTFLAKHNLNPRDFELYSTLDIIESINVEEYRKVALQLVDRLETKDTYGVKKIIDGEEKIVSISKKVKLKEDALASHYSIHLYEIVGEIEKLLDIQNAK